MSILTDDGKILSTKALIDSGCTGSLINASFVEQNHIPVHQLPRKIPVYNADGTPNSRGAISFFVMVELIINNHIEWIALAVTDLGTHKIYVSYDWLKKYTIRSSIGKSIHKIEFTRSNDHTSHLIDDDDDDEIQECTWCWKGGERLFQIDALEYLRFTQPQRLAMDLAIEANKVKHTKTFEEVLPEVYHDFKNNVFDKDVFEELPPWRPWDHAIELLPGDHKIDCKTYNLILSEQEELDKFLEENLRTGKIRPSKSQFTSAFFFIKKKNGKLRPVQDYQKLNAITIKNRYPLPLINELINKLKGAKYYTKLDIRWGYNNVQMKEGDEWKAAFRTNRGLFKPLVMFFRLCNLPATFQTIMNHIFQDLINRGKVVVYMI